MKNNTFVYIVIGIIIIIGAILLLKQTPSASSPNPPEDRILLFYRDGCPHCANVDKFISDNKVDEKIQFERREASNSTNASLMVKKAEICGLDTQQLGVPFLWDGSKCYTGDVDVINAFKQKTNL